jgi:LmbE family N-acetylglucosaminyl deacetylase
VQLSQAAARVVVIGNGAEDEALARTTHLGVGAHADDLEIMAWQAIAACRGQADRWFTAVVASDGAGSPRAGRFAGTSDDDMRALRLAEQRRAAELGEYAAVVALGFPSAAVRSPANPQLTADLRAVLAATRPEVVHTHSPFDAHDTHVAVCLRVIEAIRELPAEQRPRALLGGEVWRSLDWLVGEDRVAADVSAARHGGLAQLALFESQIAGGKRYDLATLGRKQANATFAVHDDIDRATAVELAVDLTRLIHEPRLDVRTFAEELVGRFADEVSARLRRLTT